MLNNLFLNRLNDDCLVVGGEDGMITVYEIPTVKNSAKNVSLKVMLFIVARKIIGKNISNCVLFFISIQELIKLETKGGPVQTLCLHDVTKFGSVDLIVADSKGTLTFFGNKQILYKMTISEGCISALAVDIDTGMDM